MKTTIIIKAFTQSEWDNVSFFATEIDLDEIAKIGDKVHLLKQDFPDLAHVSIYADGEFFCNDENDINPLEDVDFYAGEFDESNYPHPEQNIDALQMKVYGREEFCFVGYGKHTSEEFWTETITVDSIKKRMLEVTEKNNL